MSLKTYHLPDIIFLLSIVRVKQKAIRGFGTWEKEKKVPHIPSEYPHLASFVPDSRSRISTSHFCGWTRGSRDLFITQLPTYMRRHKRIKDGKEKTLNPVVKRANLSWPLVVRARGCLKMHFLSPPKKS